MALFVYCLKTTQVLFCLAIKSESFRDGAHGDPIIVLLVNIWRLLVVQAVKLQVRPAVTISHLEGPNFANILTFFGGRSVLFVHNRVEQSYHKNRTFDKLKKVLVTVVIPSG